MPRPSNLPVVDRSRLYTDADGMVVMYDTDGNKLGRCVPMPTDPEWRKRVAQRMMDINYRIAEKIATAQSELDLADYPDQTIQI